MKKEMKTKLSKWRQDQVDKEVKPVKEATTKEKVAKSGKSANKAKK